MLTNHQGGSSRARPLGVETHVIVLDRSRWLADAFRTLRPYFTAYGIDLPSLVLVKEGKVAKPGAVGECWLMKPMPIIVVDHKVNRGEHALAILVHEGLHAALPDHVEHGDQFKQWAKHLGLMGPATATFAGPRLRQVFRPIIARLGNYPIAGAGAVVTLEGHVVA